LNIGISKTSLSGIPRPIIAFSGYSTLSFIIRLLISLGACMAVAFAFRLISIRNIFRILKEEE